MVVKYEQRKKPCPTCPYAKSTPPGVWNPTEYLKLPKYDGETWEQSIALFQCHYSNRGKKVPTICQGWLDCHGAGELLAVRLAMLNGKLPDDFSFEPSGTEVYSSGEEACKAGLSGCENPNKEAKRVINKLTKMR